MTKRFISIATLALVLLFTGSASAELVAKGNLFIHFDGGIMPKALPRHTLAPIAVRIEGTVRTPKGSVPPAVRRIQIALNREGHLETRGLPVCRRRQIALASPQEALAACGPALVGGGGFTGRMALTGQPTVSFPGQILLFNTRINGHPAALAHISQTQPVVLNRIVVFHIRRTSGTFGTVITGDLPPSLNRNGYLKSIFLQLQRRYVFHGQPRSYLSASCAAPPGFTTAIFPFANASMTFSDGRTLSATMTRTCQVR
ncbi:MAG TPA: hypothetical protein VF009_09670 [Solirubrobacterales bacterium]